MVKKKRMNYKDMTWYEAKELIDKSNVMTKDIWDKFWYISCLKKRYSELNRKTMKNKKR